MNNPSSEKIAEWQERASKKQALVPKYFEVFTDKVHLECGQCGQEFCRPLIFGKNEPVFVCPIDACHARNWVPVTFQLK